jgi:signal transduction histidine kinase
MPLFEFDKTRGGRTLVAVRAQMPFAVGVVIVYAAVLVATPGLLQSPFLLTAAAIVVIATAASLLLPWERWGSWWSIAITLTDILAVSLMRAELLGPLPGAAMLAVFPLVWLAYGFHRNLLVVAIVAAALLTAVPLLHNSPNFHGEALPHETVAPVSAPEWVDLALLPALLVTAVVVLDLTATRMRRTRQREQEAHDKLQDALDESLNLETVNRAVLDTIETAVAVYDPNGRLLSANESAYGLATLAGFHLDEPPYVADKMFDADRSTPLPPDRQVISLSLQGHEFGRQLIWIGEPGEQVALIVSSRQIYRTDRKIVGTVIVGQDVTELAGAVEVRDEFLKTVSHELRTPVTNIMGYVELMEDRVSCDDPQLSGLLEVVQRNTQRLMDRVEELLAATEIASPLVIGEVDATTLVRSILTRRADAAANRALTLRHLNDAPTLLRADQHRLWLVVNELVTNAIKFATPGTTVTVTHGIRAGRLTLTVSNDGVPITPAEQARLFDRFYRAPYARANAVQGFGIGLALVLSIVRAHGGQVRIASEDGAPTRFTIDLPVGELDPSVGERDA